MTDQKRILTIEDDATVRMNIVAYLEDSGYQMIQAADGLEGLHQFKDQRPDLVLCDLRMPKLDGLDVLQEITQLSPDTPVIIVSGAGMISDAIQALKRGAWDYVTKPIPDMQVLEAAIIKALDLPPDPPSVERGTRSTEGGSGGRSQCPEQAATETTPGPGGIYF